MYTSCSLFLNDFADSGILSIAYYSHIVPVAIALFLGFYGFIKAGYTKISTIFCIFCVSFSVWLLGDLVTWTSPWYGPIIFTWSWLDYVNIIFFALGAYFFAVLARDRITIIEKVIILAVSAPAFVIAFLGSSVTEFYQPACEVLEYGPITSYKLIAELIFVALIVFSLFVAWSRSDRAKRIQLSVVALAVLLFFAVFSSTEYIATITNVYEINLYGLFVLPIFLIVMVFAITNLGVFKIRFIGTQLLVYTLIIMVGSQFLFLESSTDAALNIVTIIITIFFGLVLLRNTKKEMEARIQIEKLAHDLEKANARLKELDKQKTEFVSFASHQLRGPLTAIRGYVSLILEGDYGQIAGELKKAVQIVFDSTKTLSGVIDDYLNVTRIELGEMKYDFTEFDFSELVRGVLDELKPNVDKAGLKLDFTSDPKGNFRINADQEKIKQVISNIVDNSIKYTPTGGISVNVQELDNKVRLSIKDTGIGISKEEVGKLFAKFKRAANANKTNMKGTGLGLFIAKEIIERHKGKIWVESDGVGKGTTFYIEIGKRN